MSVRDGRSRRVHVSLPEQVRQELEDFIALGEENTPPWESEVDKNMTTLTKAIALQQAGILPLNHDLAWCMEAARTQLELEGLLKGY